MNIISCWEGPEFSLLGEAKFSSPSFEFLTAFTIPTDESLVTKYQWFFDGKLVLGVASSAFNGTADCGSHKIGVRVLANEQWSGIVTMEFETCAPLFDNTLQEKFFYKANCGEGYQGAAVLFSVGPGEFRSFLSVEDANNKAKTYIDANGQAHADNAGDTYCIPEDSVPDQFNFEGVNGWEINSLAYSATVTITGINRSAVITVSGGEYSVNGGSWTSLPGEVSLNDQVAVRGLSSPDHDTEKSVFLFIGGIVGTFQIRTKAIYYNVERTGSFPKTNCGPGYQGADVPFSVPAGQYFSFTSVSEANLQADDYLSANGPAYANGKDGAFCIPTDNVPDNFTFNARLDTELDLVYESDAITVSGINIATTISVSNGEFQVNGGPWIVSNSQIYNGDLVKVRRMASSNYDESTYTALNIGGISATFEVRTKKIYYSVYKQRPFYKNNCGSGYNGSTVLFEVPARAYQSFNSQEEADGLADQFIDQNGQIKANNEGYCTAYDAVPDDYFFEPVGHAEPGALYESLPATIYGLTLAAQVVVSGGEYRIESGNWTSDPGYIQNGDRIWLRGNASVAYSGISTVSVTIGGVNGSFQITTKAIYYNELQQKEFTRDNCGSSYAGSKVNYQVLAGIVSSFESIIDANVKAMAYINANGQAYANNNGTCQLINPPPSALVVDITSDFGFKLIGYVGNSEVVGNHDPAYAGKYIVPTSTGASEALILASDLLPNSPKWRFIFNIAKLVIDYPAIPEFTFYIKGRASSNANVFGSWALRPANQTMSLDVINGYHIPSINGDGGTPENFNTLIASGVANSYAEADLEYVLKFVYTASSKSVAVYPVRSNTEKTQTFNKSDCPEGNGSAVTYVVNGGKYFDFSQQAANDRADQDMTTNGQAYANINGYCIIEDYYLVIGLEPNSSNPSVRAYLRDSNGNPVTINESITFDWYYDTQGRTGEVLYPGSDNTVLLDFKDNYDGSHSGISNIYPPTAGGHNIYTQ